MSTFFDTLRELRFSSNPLAVFVNPFFLARRALHLELRRLSKDLSGRLLDVGCGSSPYRALFSHCAYVGLDIDSPTTRRIGTADLFYDGKTFPIATNSFDSILCNQVLEHVFEPDHFVGEMARVLRPGGKLVLSVPFVWDEHEQPYDYARYSSFGLQALLKRNGFEITRHTRTLGNAGVLFQLANAYIYKIVRPRSKWAMGIWTLAIMCPVSLMGWLASALSPRNDDLYLDQIVLATRREE